MYLTYTTKTVKIFAENFMISQFKIFFFQEISLKLAFGYKNKTQLFLKAII